MPNGSSTVSVYPDNDMETYRDLLYYFDNGNDHASGGWFLLCNYLAAVNNLEMPVTKTRNKTMKIPHTEKS